MNPVIDSKRHFSRSANLMMNVNFDLLRMSNPKYAKSEDFIQKCLKDAISSAYYIEGSVGSSERISNSNRRFDSAIRYMKNSEIPVTTKAMVAVLVNSLDPDALKVMKANLSTENTSFIDSLNNSNEAQNNMSINKSGPSI